MKKIKRKAIAAFLMSAILITFLAACAKTNDTNQSSVADKQESSSEGTAQLNGEKTKVLVWSKNSHDLEYMTKKIAEFNATNTDNIEIEYVVQSSSDYINLLTMSASSGQSPDIFVNTNINLQEFVEADIIQPLTNMITEEFDKVNQVSDVMFEGITSLGEEVYFVPTGMRSGSRLIYNVDLFNAAGVEVPKTLEDAVKVAKTLTEAGNGASYGTIFPGLSSPFERWIEHSAELSGVRWYDYENGRFDFTGYKPFVEAIRTMFEDESVFPGSASMQIDPSRTQFASGNVGFYGNASQEAGVLTEQFPAECEWAVAQLPTLDGENKGALQCEPSLGWYMSDKTEHTAESWKVIEFFGTEEFLKGYIESGYCLPISKYMDSVVDKDALGRLADFSLEDYEAVYPKPPVVSPAGETYRDALWNACLPNGGNIDEIIENLNKTYNEALDKEVAVGKIKRIVIEGYDPLKPNAGKISYLTK